VAPFLHFEGWPASKVIYAIQFAAIGSGRCIVPRSILIGLDGSPSSDRAVELCIRWAGRFDLLLVGLGVVDEPAIRRPEPVPLGAGAFKEHRDDVLVARARRQVEQFLEQFTLRCAEANVPHKLLENVGVPAEQILLEAQRYDLIVLGQQSHFRFAPHQTANGTLSRVLKNTPRPVVAVPEHAGAGTTVMVAYDGSLQAARALHAFQASGLAAGDPVHIVSVGADHTEQMRHADRAAEFLRLHGIESTPHVVAASSSVGDALLEQARHLDARLFVMGAYGQPTLREFFLGSVTRTVLEKSPVPLFLYH
jgi:nucleotide-binding universal stress UspA family protein